jgi:mono/diheme cytochrome c family protein
MRTPACLCCLVTVVVVIVAATPCPARAQTPAAPAAASPINGKKVYEAYGCYACHGFNGETGARVLVPSRSPNLAAEANFITFLRARANLAPVQPSTSMPNYSASTLTDAQARDLYAYVKTFKSSAPAVDEIPIFKQILSSARKPYKP